MQRGNTPGTNNVVHRGNTPGTNNVVHRGNTPGTNNVVQRGNTLGTDNVVQRGNTPGTNNVVHRYPLRVYNFLKMLLFGSHTIARSLLCSSHNDLGCKLIKLI